MEESLHPFVNRTVYDEKALEALNNLAESSVRRGKSQQKRFLALLMGAVGLVLGVLLHNSHPMIAKLLLLYGVILLLLSLYWKKFQLKSSQRQLRASMRNCLYEFSEEGFTCSAEGGTEVFLYDQITAVVTDKDWIALFFDEGHGVILDKNGFTAGDAMGFRGFIGMHTQLPIQDL